MTEQDVYTTAEAAQVLSVSPRRIRQMAAEGSLTSFRGKDGALTFPQTAVHEARSKKRGRKSRGRKPAEQVIDLRERDDLQQLVEAIVNATLPRAIEAATSAERVAREAAQAALFEAMARAQAAEQRADAAEAQLAAIVTAPKKRRWGRRKP